MFKPGKGIFRDYDHFYLGKGTRILQFERAADEAKVQKPLGITRYFFEQRLGTRISATSGSQKGLSNSLAI